MTVEDDVPAGPAQPLACIPEEQVQARISKEKRRLNQVTPAGKLPTELLLVIFMFLSSDWHTGDCTWIRGTHVCYAWREAALSFPTLWAQVIAHTLEWTQLLLTRSEGAKLDVVIRLAARPFGKVVRLITRELHRIRSLEWRDYTHSIVDPAAPTFAPFLRSVTLQSGDIAVQNAQIPYSTPFDDMHLPNLERLSVIGTPISWEMNNLFAPRLTHLCWVSDDPDFEMYLEVNGSMSFVMEVLSGMQNLQVLKLGNVLPPFTTDDMGVDIDLPVLCMLDIEAPANTVRMFLESVSFPKHADIAVALKGDIGSDFGDGDPEESDGERVVALLASRLSLSADESRDAPRALQSLCGSATRIEAWTVDHGAEALACGDVALRDFNMSSGRTVHLSVGTLEGRSPFKFSRELFERCYDRLPLAQVTSAVFHLDDLESEHWNVVHLATPCLRELGVSGPPESHRPVIASLSETTSSPQTARALAELEVLVLSDVTIPVDALAEERPPHLLHEYANALRARAVAGRKLSRLVLVCGTGICQEDVDLLRDVVGEVRHDGELPTFAGLQAAAADAELRALPPVLLRWLMSEAGFTHNDLPALTHDEKRRLVALRRRPTPSGVPFRDMRAGAQDRTWYVHVIQDGAVVSVPWGPYAPQPVAVGSVASHTTAGDWSLTRRMVPLRQCAIRSA